MTYTKTCEYERETLVSWETPKFNENPEAFEIISKLDRVANQRTL